MLVMKLLARRRLKKTIVPVHQIANDGHSNRMVQDQTQAGPSSSVPPPLLEDPGQRVPSLLPSDSQIPCSTWKPDWACPPYCEEQLRIGPCYFQNN